MPATTPAEAADLLAASLADARHLIWCPDAGAPTSGSVSGSAVASSPPWNAAAANAVLDAHEGIRRLEAAARMEVNGHPGTARGGSDGNTAAALRAIVNLSEAVADPRQITRRLLRWSDALKRLAAVDTLARWTTLNPRVPCPYCQRPSLRVAERSGIVMCFYPACKDGDGNTPPVGRLDWSRLDGSPVLAWADGLVQGAT